jgi:hypothetical protein
MTSSGDPVAFRIDAIPRATLDDIWRTGHDRYGNRMAVTINREVRGALLRCCHREAAVGEAVALIAYAPF